MRRWYVSILMILLVAGCSAESFPAVTEKDFVATVNIIEPSLSYFTPDGNNIATWAFKRAYTGATLLNNDQIIMYGFGLTKATVYEVTTGKKKYDLSTGTGVTNMYYDNHHDELYIANGETNTLQVYTGKGKYITELRVGNYPMSMYGFDNDLYVVNYKDTELHVVNMNTHTVKDKWAIDTSSSGLIKPPNKDELWLGGHGAGANPNAHIKRYDTATGQMVGTIHAPLMPINFAIMNDTVLAISHGRSTLYALTSTGQMQWKRDVGANPFTVATMNDTVFVAGYDDHKLYMLREGEIIKMIDVPKGPFQVLVREG